MIGMFAISKAGHDKGRMYLVVGQEKDLVLLADGKTRTMENPKRKKTKHIQIIKKDPEAFLSEKLQNHHMIYKYNEEIKLAIKKRMNKEATHV